MLYRPGWDDLPCEVIADYIESLVTIYRVDLDVGYRVIKLETMACYYSINDIFKL